MNTLDEKQIFIIFVLEAYKKLEEVSALKAFSDFKENKVFSFLEDSYDVLHTQSLDYVVSEVRLLISKK